MGKNFLFAHKDMKLEGQRDQGWRLKTPVGEKRAFNLLVWFNLWLYAGSSLGLLFVSCLCTFHFLRMFLCSFCTYYAPPHEARRAEALPIGNAGVH